MAELNQRFGASATEEGRVADAITVDIVSKASHEMQLREYAVGIDSRNLDIDSIIFSPSTLAIAVTVFNPTFVIV